MKNEKDKKALLNQLRLAPVVELACKKSGISRATFYRWKAEDKEFAKAADEALLEGESLISDLSENQLISLIRDRNFPAIQLWLKHHHPKYTTKIQIEAVKPEEDLSPEQEALVRRALELATLENFENIHDKESKKPN